MTDATPWTEELERLIRTMAASVRAETFNRAQMLGALATLDQERQALVAVRQEVTRLETQWRAHQDVCLEASAKIARERHELEDRLAAMRQELDALRERGKTLAGSK